MERKTPKQVIEDMIETHGYKNIVVGKGRNQREDEDLYTVISINDLPHIIFEYIVENYNVIFGSANRLEFLEYMPIGVEIANENKD